MVSEIRLRIVSNEMVRVYENDVLLGVFTPKALFKLLRKRLDIEDFENAFETY